MKSILFLSLIIGAAIFGVVTYKNSAPMREVPQNQIIQNNDTQTTKETVLMNDKPTKKSPVIVELFTSEGCSSCPPADQNLSFLVREQPFKDAEVIALSEHVDYWNQGGWADPYSSAQFSNRQSEYSQAFEKNGNIYTPQMVVDGKREFVGSNDREAQNAINEAAKQPKGDLQIELGKIENNAVTVNVKIDNLPQITNNDKAILLIAVTENNLASSVARGENAGRKLLHTAVVRSLINAGSVNNDSKTLSSTVQIGKELKLDNVKIVAFIQETRNRRILGASSANVK